MDELKLGEVVPLDCLHRLLVHFLDLISCERDQNAVGDVAAQNLHVDLVIEQLAFFLRPLDRLELSAANRVPNHSLRRFVQGEGATPNEQKTYLTHD